MVLEIGVKRKSWQVAKLPEGEMLLVSLNTYPEKRGEIPRGFFNFEIIFPASSFVVVFFLSWAIYEPFSVVQQKTA